MRYLIFVVLLAVSMGPHAAVVLDQYQIGYSDTPLALGGDSEQRVSQTFEAGISGSLSHVTLVMNCTEDSLGTLTVEIQETGSDGLPNGTILGVKSVAAASLHRDPIAWHDFYIDGVTLIAGTHYAIVYGVDDKATCSTRPGAQDPGMFAYPRGVAYFDARPNPPGWVEFSPGRDLFFYVYVDDGELDEPQYCEFEDANGIANDWLPKFVPACGCLSEPSLRINRCWFAFPEFTLWRETPLPWEKPTGNARWNLLPLNSDLIGVRATEFDNKQQYYQDPVTFRRGLSAGKLYREQTYYQSSSSEIPFSTEVEIEFRTPDGDGSVRFRTLITEPGQ